MRRFFLALVAVSAISAGISTRLVASSIPQSAARTDVDALKKAASHGDADAMLKLGFAYENGRSVKQDYAQAAAWYRKAIAAGHSQAMFFLGVLCWTGRGVQQDYVEAYKWFDLGSTFGSSDDRKRSADVRDSVVRSGNMSPQLIAEAQARVQGWLTAFETRKK